MSKLSWNEVRDRAIAFSRRWLDERSEAGGKQTFWNEFFAVFGRDRRVVASFEVAVRNLSGDYNYIDLLWKGILLVEHKSAGKSLAAAELQAFDYVQDLIREDRAEEAPRYVIVSDFQRFAIYDLEPEEELELPIFAGIRYSQVNFSLAELHKFVRHFAFLKGEKTLRLNPEDPANEKAYAKMCLLHDQLAANGFSGTDLERLLVRILFCVFADDTLVFEPDTFQTFIKNTREDGGDVGAVLNELFELLNTPEEQWPTGSRERFAGFRYINGDLFQDRLRFPPFNRSMRAALIGVCEFQWARVSPAVFGSLFQGILDDEERRQQGAHYTSERDILKVIRSLFLDDLRAEFETIKLDRSTRRQKRLDDFHDKLRSLKFLDPACGCGNFLVIGYRELRQLELEILREQHTDGQQFLDVRQLIRVDVDQFHGVELSEWPTRIAEVAMWLMDHQMNLRTSEALGQSFERLPLQNSPHLVQGNALDLNWNHVLLISDEVIVLGNPPFIGKQFRSASQQADMERIWGHAKGSGVLDYVTCWYWKAAEYMAQTRARAAFVSTNSITQGEQVGVLWTELFSRFRQKIHFGHRTFVWESEARGKAHVHVVIVGFGPSNVASKKLYEYESGRGEPSVSQVENISPYLIAGGDIVLTKRSKPLADVPTIVFGSMPNDGGHLLLDADERGQLLAAEPDAAPFLHPFVGADEFINGLERWCLWLKGSNPASWRKMPAIRDRVAAVKQHRLASTRTTTRALADQPSLFGEDRQPTTSYLLIPGVSSESRKYIPIGFLRPNVIASNLVNVVPSATLFHFGVLTSRMHMAWIAQVCGRLKSDYRYSNQIVYNNYPWPAEFKEDAQQKVEQAAKGVLDARTACGDGKHGYLPLKKKAGAASLADLYDPLTMPALVAKAHAALDRAVDRCYRRETFRSDRERVEHLFRMYEQLTAPLLPTTGRPKRARRKTPPVE